MMRGFDEHHDRRWAVLGGILNIEYYIKYTAIYTIKRASALLSLLQCFTYTLI